MEQIIEKNFLFGSILDFNHGVWMHYRLFCYGYIYQIAKYSADGDESCDIIYFQILRDKVSFSIYLYFTSLSQNLGYNIYTALADRIYQLLVSLFAETTFTETALSSYTRFCRVSAVDSEGKERPLSEVVCNDNCL